MPTPYEHIAEEIKNRRTFAIISHPDAGKTTLTEKLLLFGGAIREAGAVKGKRNQKHATSDWMEIEKKRGISVTSTVLQFHYQGCQINILDTPGHEDFSEDTYRTLTAADSAVMLIDAAKGVEPQTMKLFEVCRMRGIPIFTFVNKLDREGRDPFSLLKELEDVLGIKSYPMNWPVGMGGDFQGIFNRSTNCVEKYFAREALPQTLCVNDVSDAALTSVLGVTAHDKLTEDIQLLNVAGDAFDSELVAKGELTPVFFGSAVASFGVETFLKQFIDMAPSPTPRQSSQGPIDPAEAPFSGFVFKIQANMNPAHRDRVAFLRICSGKFERGMSVQHVRTNKKINLTQPQQFFAEDRTIVEEAYPGDIIGLFDPGLFKIGDTICHTGSFQYEKLPQFSPEYFCRVTVKDTNKYKQFHKGLQQLSEEGSVQVFRMANRTEDILLGVVGKLQLEVFEYRLKAEYGTEIILSAMPYQFARWLSTNEIDKVTYDHYSCLMVKDEDDRAVLLLSDQFSIRWVESKNPNISFHTTSFGL